MEIIFVLFFLETFKMGLNIIIKSFRLNIQQLRERVCARTFM